MVVVRTQPVAMANFRMINLPLLVLLSEKA